MPPVNLTKSTKTVNNERKQQRKKWKEHKLLKAAGFQKGMQDTVKKDEELKDSNNSSCSGSFKQNNTHSYTVSIAVPGSILDNAQSPELRSYLVGQVARAACIYRVDEVIVFDDGGTQKNNNGACKPEEESTSEQFARLLQYLECPQYLRKHLYPLHRDLQYAGVLNPLDAPHHLRQADDFPYREGVVTHHLVKQGKGSYVNVGLLRDVCIDRALVPDVRVTVKLLPSKEGSKKRYGLIVPPTQPREELGVYWGYTVRVANSLSDVFAKSPYQESYDLTIGTSDKGTPLDDCDDADFANFKHVLVVFGGLEGLESALESDENLTIEDVKLFFDKYVNTCPKQGSRTIRTEEAILISLAQLSKKFNSNNPTLTDEK